LSPTGYGDSPYQCFSAFGGNPLLIDLRALQEQRPSVAYSRELAAYTGGHENDTAVGWCIRSAIRKSTRTAEDIRKERDFTRAYLGFQNEPVDWLFIRAVLASVAAIAIIPLQDVLGLGSEARMNLVHGNWKCVTNRRL
jgi:4-alpha-glucanotransferase